MISVEENRRVFEEILFILTHNDLDMFFDVCDDLKNESKYQVIPLYMKKEYEQLCIKYEACFEQLQECFTTYCANFIPPFDNFDKKEQFEQYNKLIDTANKIMDFQSLVANKFVEIDSYRVNYRKRLTLVKG
ncbi:MAG: hypothetical protein ACOCQR_00870 [bacterium]